MERSAVIVDSSTLKMQFTRLAKDFGIYQWERYIDASSVDNWQDAGQQWIENAVDPDAVCV